MSLINSLAANGEQPNMAIWTMISCPTAQFPPTYKLSGHRHQSLDTSEASNAFWCNFSYTAPRNFIQLSNRCTVCWKSHFKNHFPYLMKSWVHLTFVAHLSNIKGFENNKTEWPDKCNKTRFAGGQWGGGFFCHGYLAQLNSLGSLVDWVMGLFYDSIYVHLTWKCCHKCSYVLRLL